MKKYHFILIAFALICLVSGSVTGAISYFTTFAEARGEKTLHLIEQTRIWEDVEENSKKLTVYNTDKHVPVYVRAKGFSSGDYSLKYDAPGKNWVDGGDGYWYYSNEDGTHKILEPGQNTSRENQLIVSISRTVTTEPTDGETFNIVVVYEAAPVIYEDGKPKEDWNQTLIKMNN